MGFSDNNDADAVSGVDGLKAVIWVIPVEIASRVENFIVLESCWIDIVVCRLSYTMLMSNYFDSLCRYYVKYDDAWTRVRARESERPKSVDD